MNGLPVAVRILTAAFPREFRQRFGEDMRQCIRDARDALGDAPASERATFWMLILIDLARASAVEHVRSRRARPRSLPLRLLGFASLMAAIANVLVDLLYVELQMGIGALLLSALGITLGAVLARPRPARP
jgi:hypothetical protein